MSLGFAAIGLIKVSVHMVNDRNLRKGIFLILRIGVIISVLLIVFGGLFFFLRHTNEILSFKTFSSQPERLRKVEVIIHEALQLRSRSVIQLGILILISTPVLRVIFSFIQFSIYRDWIYSCITTLLMIILFYSLLN